MKIGGIKHEYLPASDIIVFPRPTQDIAFRATAMLDRRAFDKLVKEPKIKKMRTSKGDLVPNPEDEGYKISVQQYNKRYMQYMFLTCLTAIPADGSEDLPVEWETVELEKPETWGNWEKELEEAGFSEMERQRLYNLVMRVNSLDENRMDEARKSFLLRQQEEQNRSSLKEEEQIDTLSGEAAIDSESDLQESQKVGTN